MFAILLIKYHQQAGAHIGEHRQMTNQVWLKLSKRVNELLANPEIDGGYYARN